MSPAGHTAGEGLKPVSTPQGSPCLLQRRKLHVSSEPVPMILSPNGLSRQVFRPPALSPQSTMGWPHLTPKPHPPGQTTPSGTRPLWTTPALDHTHSLQQTCESGSPRAPNCFTRLCLVPGRHSAYSKAWWMTSIRIIRKCLLSGSLFCTFIQKTHWILNSKRQYHLPLMENLRRSLPTARIWGETFEKTQPMRLRISETGRRNKESR